jgi:hypothetical protein
MGFQRDASLWKSARQRLAALPFDSEQALELSVGDSFSGLKYLLILLGGRRKVLVHVLHNHCELIQIFDEIVLETLKEELSCLGVPILTELLKGALNLAAERLQISAFFLQSGAGCLKSILIQM